MTGASFFTHKGGFATMKEGCKKYIPFQQIPLKDREWPNKVIDKAPIWCSVDLRDGNQALINPMNLQEKLEMFQLLVKIGVKEIEVGFPSASETEYEILRTLIEGNYIPDDVTIQVLVQARPHLIEKTFEAIDGAKNVIVHFYNSTSTLQRKVVFQKDMEGITEIAVKGAKLIKELTDARKGNGTNIRFEYSPESFSGTEMDFAVDICHKVMEELGASADNKVILNLPSTVEGSTPNGYADQIEYFCKHLPNRENAIISLHPHNDRGTAVAAAELALMAGADRIEGTLFGNGERTGNVDIVTLAMNMYTQAVDPELDFSNINEVKKVYENTTKMVVSDRHPYAGTLVFTAFSGSHQDAINKGKQYMATSGTEYWEIPYLPIDPADVGREYEPIIRINSQSGKGGAAFVMQDQFGYKLPKAMHPEFGAIVKAACDASGRELMPNEVFALFEQEYLSKENNVYQLLKHKTYEESTDGDPLVHMDCVVSKDGIEMAVESTGNGPINAFTNIMKNVTGKDIKFVSYHQHAITTGSDARAVSYIEILMPDGKNYFGVGISHNINMASIRGLLCAVNRAEKQSYAN